MFCRLITGLFLIALGISMILKIYFKIEIPVFKSFLAIGLILIGLSILTEPFCYQEVFMVCGR